MHIFKKEYFSFKTTSNLTLPRFPFPRAITLNFWAEYSYLPSSIILLLLLLAFSVLEFISCLLHGRWWFSSISIVSLQNAHTFSLFLSFCESHVCSRVFHYPQPPDMVKCVRLIVTMKCYSQVVTDEVVRMSYPSPQC